MSTATKTPPGGKSVNGETSAKKRAREKDLNKDSELASNANRTHHTHLN